MINPRRERTVRARVLWGFHPKDGLSAAPGIAFHYSLRHRRRREDQGRSWERKEKGIQPERNEKKKEQAAS